MADMMYAGATASGDLGEENNIDFYGWLNNINTRQRFPGLYVGNLTWWTTDQDVINAIYSVGVTDVQEVKFFENRNNGQSKGFCIVTFGSDAPLSTVMEKLPKLELYGQNPVVTPYNRQNLNLFESQTKVRPQINSNNGPNSHAAGIMGISSISGVHANTQGLPYSGLNTYNQGPRGPSYMGNRPQMRGPRMPPIMGMAPVMRGPPLMPGPMNRMRFVQPQPSSLRPHRGESPRREDKESSRREDSGSSRRDDIGSSRRDDIGSSRRDDIGSSRRDDISSSRREEIGSSRREESGSSRREERESSRRREERESSRRREERGSSRRREEKSSRREKSHRSDDRGRSRSRERSRERTDRRDRRERY